MRLREALMRLTGLHHLTAITANAPRNHAFYTQMLGMRLVKKTVNQDDVSAYHLFYADGEASPGSDLTFFDWPVQPEVRGGRSIARTGLRVAGENALAWWMARFKDAGVAYQAPARRAGRATVDFEDFEGQRLSLVDDGGAGPAHAWDKSPVPPAYQIRGLGPVTLSAPDPQPTEVILTHVMGMTRIGEEAADGAQRMLIYSMGDGGAGAELHLRVEPDAPAARQGAGGAHHVAFRIPDADYDGWAERLKEFRLPNSGPVDRYYFRSLYFREPNGVLFEIATDGPGFAADEPMDKLGERLALPPFLEPRRRQIEAGLKPL